MIRNRNAFERARKVGAVLFDKAGTLTEGRFGVSDVIPLAEKDETEIPRLAAGLESQSEHPIAKGIVDKAKDEGIDLTAPGDFSAIPGKGAQGILEGQNLKVVSPGYLDENDITVDDDTVRQVAEQSKTVVYLLVEQRVVGAIGLAYIIRHESREAIERLNDMGIQTMMITGDSEVVAKRGALTDRGRRAHGVVHRHRRHQRPASAH